MKHKFNFLKQCPSGNTLLCGWHPDMLDREDEEDDWWDKEEEEVVTADENRPKLSGND